ncbi:MAG: hypothetical protein DMD48_15345 [Gemmatimonadetes bacterium]|nr:MAG: hypothetical protein DMD48_15345 [Gemmatimonadota bacterium]
MKRALAVTFVLITGCAGLKNTPIQDYVLETGRACETVSAGWRILRVDTAGHYWITGEGPAGIPMFHACMKEPYAKKPFNAWLKAQTRESPISSQPPRPEVAGPPPPASGSSAAVVAETVWQPGYQWTYRYESPRDSGTFAWVVNREEVLDGIRFYVVASGTREIYFRKSDFAHYMDKVNGAVEVRNTPPIRLASGTAGDKWELRYVRETPQQQSTQNIVRTCETSGPETVTVPAGTFEAMKTTCVNARTGETDYEIWYSAAVKQMIRERTRFSYGWRERELIGMRMFPDRVQ